MVQNQEGIVMNLHLEQPASKSHVVDHFCKLAVETTYCDVRDALLETLKDSKEILKELTEVFGETKN
jgi:hypothetical protein